MKANLVRWGLALGLTALLGACGGGNGSSTVAERQLPTSAQNTPVDSFTPATAKSAEVNSDYTLGASDPAPSYKVTLGSAGTEVAKLQSTVDIRSIGQAPQIGLGRKIAELDSVTTFASRLQWTTGSDGSQRAAVRFVSSGAAGTRLVLDVTIDDVQAIPILAGIIGDQRGGRGEVLVHVGIPGGEAELVLGRDFRLDGELAQKIENVPGIRWASLKSAAAKLAEAA